MIKLINPRRGISLHTELLSVFTKNNQDVCGRFSPSGRFAWVDPLITAEISGSMKFSLFTITVVSYESLAALPVFETLSCGNVAS